MKQGNRRCVHSPYGFTPTYFIEVGIAPQILFNESSFGCSRIFLFFAPQSFSIRFTRNPQRSSPIPSKPDKERSSGIRPPPGLRPGGVCFSPSISSSSLPLPSFHQPTSTQLFLDPFFLSHPTPDAFHPPYPHLLFFPKESK